MRADLQTLLNAPPISNGHERKNKQIVLAYLMMKAFAPNVTLTMPNVSSKVSGLQGLSPDAMLDLLIQGLLVNQGLSGQTWKSIKDTAEAAINGQGVNSGALQVNMGEKDFVTLQNYAMLTACKVLNDAS